MFRSLQLTEFRSLQLTETCRLNFSQANVILKDPVVVNQTLVAVARIRVATILEFQVCEILAVAVAVVADFGVWKRLAVGLMAPLQESVLHLVAKHCVCV